MAELLTNWLFWAYIFWLLFGSSLTSRSNNSSHRHDDTDTSNNSRHYEIYTGRTDGEETETDQDQGHQEQAAAAPRFAPQPFPQRSAAASLGHHSTRPIKTRLVPSAFAQPPLLSSRILYPSVASPSPRSCSPPSATSPFYAACRQRTATATTTTTTTANYTHRIPTPPPSPRARAATATTTTAAPAAAMAVECPACNKPVRPADINSHLDSGCADYVIADDEPRENHNSASATSSFASSNTQSQAQAQTQAPPPQSQTTNPFFTPASQKKRPASAAFITPAPKRQLNLTTNRTPATIRATRGPSTTTTTTTTTTSLAGQKRTRSEAELSPSDSRIKHEQGTGLDAGGGDGGGGGGDGDDGGGDVARGAAPPVAKKAKATNAVPLAERMRPETLDDILGQELVSQSGILRSLIASSASGSAADGGLPSMILWGASGTGKTTIARCVARSVSARFVELNATSTGVAECKKLFAEAESELRLLGRRTIIFCDEIHRFSKSQQDVFLRPVEAGTITLIGATTENPSFKLQNALLSRCRTFTLQKLSAEDVARILRRALASERERRRGDTDDDGTDTRFDALLDDEMLGYLAKFADGDARTALNLLEMAISLVRGGGGDGVNGGGAPAITKQDIKASLTQTLVYDRAGDQHYDTISAFHKSVRGGDADAALYYLARMLQSGEDPLYVSRRMVVIASEDIGLADSSMLQLATATHTAVQQIGMPEARIPLAHCAVALALAPKSTRAYRALSSVMAALREPGVAGLPVPMHLRNAPTKLMREMGCGVAYKYPPNYVDGRVSQTYLPEGMIGRRFLEERDLGTEIDPDLEMTGV